MKKIIVLGLAIGLLTACDKLHSDASSSSTTTTTTATTTVTATTAAATTTTTAATTAAATTTAVAADTASAGGWPAYLPDYPGAKVTKKTKDFASLETKDPADKVLAFYKDKLKSAGFPPGAWASLAGTKGDQPAVLTASKGSEMVQVTVTPVQGTTKISLSIM